RASELAERLERRLGSGLFPDGGEHVQPTIDGVPTLWLVPERVPDVLRYLKHELAQPYEMLYDLTAIDERVRHVRDGQPGSELTLVYHLMSFSRNEDVRLKVPLADGESVESIVDVWPNA